MVAGMSWGWPCEQLRQSSFYDNVQQDKENNFVTEHKASVVPPLVNVTRGAAQAHLVVLEGATPLSTGGAFQQSEVAN